MVAAALEKAHSDVIAKLPGYAAGTAVGWRFMDKFVQLPFVIPPPEALDIDAYVNSLFEEEATTKSLPREIRFKIDEATRNLEPEKVSAVVHDVSRFVNNYDLSAAQHKEVASRLEQVKKIAEIDAEINRASRDNETMRSFVLQVAPDFFRNPRDLKRFLNTFRLHDFLRIARERRNQQAPSRELIAKWIVLSLKWPQVIRWMHRVPGEFAEHPVKKDRTASLSFRLRQLEVLAAEIPSRHNIEEWRELFVAALGAEAKNFDWLADRSLFEFFWDMGRAPEDQRLSQGAGKGLW
jgi:hypothetical protein